MFTRRTATVTMSAPDAACAWAMTAFEGYLPVPTIRRDANVRPAMTNGRINGHAHDWSTLEHVLPAADEVHDLDGIAVGDDDVGERVALENGEVVLDGDAPRVDVELRQQVDDRQRLVELESFAVQRDEHGTSPQGCAHACRQRIARYRSSQGKLLTDIDLRQ